MQKDIEILRLSGLVMYLFGIISLGLMAISSVSILALDSKVDLFSDIVEVVMLVTFVHIGSYLLWRKL